MENILIRNQISNSNHQNQNHPPSIIRYASCDKQSNFQFIFSEDEFEQAKRQYESTICESGFKISIKYIPSKVSKQKHKRQRKMSGSIHLSARMSKQNRKIFFKLICKQFPRSLRFSKI